MKLDHFERLAESARTESPSLTNVADRVLSTLHGPLRTQDTREPEYAMFGYGSVLAACTALVLFTMITSNDSLIVLADPFITVLP